MPRAPGIGLAPGRAGPRHPRPAVRRPPRPTIRPGPREASPGWSALRGRAGPARDRGPERMVRPDPLDPLVRHRTDGRLRPGLGPAPSQAGHGGEGLVGLDRDQLLRFRPGGDPLDPVDLAVEDRPAQVALVHGLAEALQGQRSEVPGVDVPVELSHGAQCLADVVLLAGRPSGLDVETLKSKGIDSLLAVASIPGRVLRLSSWPVRSWPRCIPPRRGIRGTRS